MHECPECYERCMCKGDIDDIDWGEVDWCEHWKICGRDIVVYEEEECEEARG